jgi:hypothetical protein
MARVTRLTEGCSIVQYYTWWSVNLCYACASIGCTASVRRLNSRPCINITIRSTAHLLELLPAHSIMKANNAESPIYTVITNPSLSYSVSNILIRDICGKKSSSLLSTAGCTIAKLNGIKHYLYYLSTHRNTPLKLVNDLIYPPLPQPL